MGFKYKLTKEGMEKSGPGYLFSDRDFKEHAVI